MLLATLIPLVGKRAAAEVEDLFRAEVAERGLHHAPGGGGGEEDRAAGADELPELGLGGGIERLELRAAVADHRLAHGGVGFL